MKDFKILKLVTFSYSSEYFYKYFYKLSSIISKIEEISLFHKLLLADWANKISIYKVIYLLFSFLRLLIIYLSYFGLLIAIIEVFF